MTETIVKPSPPLSYTQKLSLMAGSATVLYGLLPAAASAADIQYRPSTPVTISFAQIGQSVGWDVDGNGATDFNLRAGTSLFGGTLIQLTSSGLSGRGFVNDILDAPEDIRWLQAGLLVTNTLGVNLPIDYVWGGIGVANRKVLSFDGAAFLQPNVRPSTQSSGFIGFRFLGQDSEIHYGWAEMRIIADAATLGNSRVIINRWAYNAVGCGAGVPLNSACVSPGVNGSGIRVGDIGGGSPPTPSVPEPTSPLTLLALGAAGVYRWRKERQERQD